MNIRTDLALEAHEYAAADGRHLEGVRTHRRQYGPLWGDVVEILDERGQHLTGKPRGSYVTLQIGRVWQDTPQDFRDKALALGQVLREWMGEPCRGQVLVAGLGNRHITADCLGPLAVDNLIVTRHIKKERPGLFRSLELGEVAALTPGVLGQTGMESADILQCVCRQLAPSALVAVDALAARRLDRLVTTLQISDNGFSPGSGVNNRRASVDQSTVGCPVITVGVPTVVDAATLAYDALCGVGAQQDLDRIRDRFETDGLNFFVTPKETDSIIRRVGALIGYGLNLALHPNMDYDTMLSLATS